MIDLSNAELIGQGRDRLCYRHPDFSDRCIKVSKRPQKQTRRERAYFAYIYKKQKNTSHLSRYLDTVTTNYGEGAVFELILNENGQSGSTLTELIKQDKIPPAQINPLLDQLKDYLFDQKICVRDLSPNNLMCQHKENEIKLIIVDGVSNPGINPLNIRVGYLTRYFIHRSWKSLEKKIQKIDANEK